jgi:uroporphyrin-III C-methyltransferase
LPQARPASTPVVIVENASLPEMRRIYTTLAALPVVAVENVTGPALILLGAQFLARAESDDSVDNDRRWAASLK